MSFRARLASAFLVAALFSGCGYYSFSGATIPENLNTIAIPLVADNSINTFPNLGDPRAHSTLFVLVDRDGKGRAMYHPLKDEGWIEKVVKDLDTLRTETP